MVLAYCLHSTMKGIIMKNKGHPIRHSLVAGHFYADNPEALKQQIRDCFLHSIGPQILPTFITKKERSIIGLISPHAGFFYSGPVAAHGFLRLSQEKTPKTIIIFGPNHSGRGKNISIMSSGKWETPLGVIEIDQLTAKEILANDKESILQDDKEAHDYEHSIEVQLPFLQYIYSENGYKIVPICIKSQQFDIMKYLSNIIYEIIKFNYDDFLLIASSDFNHYENQKETEYKDRESVKHIINMDSELFNKAVYEKHISICGTGPIIAVMEICKKLGINKGHLLKYATSGDISGNYDQVVGYASIIFNKFNKNE